MREMTINEVHGICLDILKDVHDFCTENGIHYSLSGGSLLGAIRHNGFIPWDDDIDVQMCRPEYERFINTYSSKHGYKLFSKEIENNENICIAFTRICEMNKTYVDTKQLPWKDTSTGLWIDILPIDGAPSNRVKAKFHILKMFLFWRFTVWHRHIFYNKISNIPNFSKKIKFLLKKFVLFFLPNDIVSLYIRMCQKYDFESCSYIANYSTMQNKLKEWQPKVSMSNYELHKFEDGNFYIMDGWEISLSSLYGDYMKLPPKEKQIPHNNSYYWKEK